MIHYKVGDATNPDFNKNVCICHICNDVGGWGAGFVLALSRKWSLPEQKYREWFTQDPKPSLGQVQIVTVAPNIVVANMIAQHGVREVDGIPPIRYDALKTCLDQVNTLSSWYEIAGPRMGAGLAGGSWNRIESIIDECFPNKKVTIYDLS